MVTKDGVDPRISNIQFSVAFRSPQIWMLLGYRKKLAFDGGDRTVIASTQEQEAHCFTADLSGGKINCNSHLVG